MRTPAKRSSRRGSHATWSPGDSRTCIHCGQKLRISLDAVWIHTDDVTGEHRSSHISCGSPLDDKEHH